MSNAIPAASVIKMITNKERNSKIGRLVGQINKKQKNLKRTQQKEKRLKLELAGLNYDLNQLKKEVKN